MTPELLESRLLDFATSACQQVRRMPRDVVGYHLGRQLLRAATSPVANYAEARGAESRRDFRHKMQICLKELRESWVWLQLAARLGPPYLTDAALTRECDELVAIFVQSVKTAKSRELGQ